MKVLCVSKPKVDSWGKMVITGELYSKLMSSCLDYKKKWLHKFKWFGCQSYCIELTLIINVERTRLNQSFSNPHLVTTCYILCSVFSIVGHEWKCPNCALKELSVVLKCLSDAVLLPSKARWPADAAVGAWMFWIMTVDTSIFILYTHRTS